LWGQRKLRHFEEWKISISGKKVSDALAADRHHWIEKGDYVLLASWREAIEENLRL